MNWRKKITKLVKSLTKEEEISTMDLVEFREHKINLCKSEVCSIVSLIDENEKGYLEMSKSTDSEIEKGFSDGEGLKEQLRTKYLRRERVLMKSLAEKKSELRYSEEKLEELVKADSPDKFGDCIVRCSKGGVLLLLRKNDSSFEPNKWGLPGGHVEEGETYEEGAVRELKEETNLTSERAEKLAHILLKDGSTICYFSVRVKEDHSVIGLDDDEHSNYCFMSIEEIRSRPESHFIIGMKDNLLKVIDPQSAHIEILEKGLAEGLIDEEKVLLAKDKYSSIQYLKK